MRRLDGRSQRAAEEPPNLSADLFSRLKQHRCGGGAHTSQQGSLCFPEPEAQLDDCTAGRLHLGVTRGRASRPWTRRAPASASVKRPGGVLSSSHGLPNGDQTYERLCSLCEIFASPTPVLTVRPQEGKGTAAPLRPSSGLPRHLWEGDSLPAGAEGVQRSVGSRCPELPPHPALLRPTGQSSPGRGRPLRQPPLGPRGPRGPRAQLGSAPAAPRHPDTESERLCLTHGDQHREEGGCQNEETKEHGPNERTGQNCRKRNYTKRR